MAATPIFKHGQREQVFTFRHLFLSIIVNPMESAVSGGSCFDIRGLGPFWMAERNRYGDAVSEVVVIAGMSGAGRTQAANALEDLGWFVVDNLPAPLIPKVGELAGGPGAQLPRVALVVGSGPAPEEVVEALTELRESLGSIQVVFLDSSDDVLVRRYRATKRRHPLSDGESLAAAIRREREVLTPVRESADLVVDTSHMTIYELRARTVELFGGEPRGDSMHTTVLSFGYKHGMPRDVDVVLDCRFLPNPYWDDDLRALSGQDGAVQEYLDGHEVTGVFLERLESLLDLLVPAYQDEGKAYLTIALGCTGGRHRSVMMAERVAQMLRDRDLDPRVTHRDIDR